MCSYPRREDVLPREVTALQPATAALRVVGEHLPCMYIYIYIYIYICRSTSSPSRAACFDMRPKGAGTQIAQLQPLRTATVYYSNYTIRYHTLL